VSNFKKNLTDRAAQLVALMLSIPAFYLLLTGASEYARNLGRLLYGATAAILALVMVLQSRKRAGSQPRSRLDLPICIGAIASMWPTATPWTSVEWALRMAFSGMVFVRLATLLAKFVVPNRLLQICTLAIFMLAIAGAGFYWLEPSVQTYGDGVWLAFTTGATVGYGDLVPTTPASRVFAAFIVLLGYALFSVVTASIAALLVGEDEKRMSREMHADMRALHREIKVLREELLSTRGSAQADSTSVVPLTSKK
jgi:voltage-gated potassium channel